ncbi:type III polyketide synthase [Kocuria sp. SM24M-10]|uniref:type III polyketide synthase n=1 Tax=Kocuria sp. SM24M-10 TaxID=1660349 RepID=UPI00064B06C0|nr:type III polyketide synthase [Kocuria sp. SM24M-10]KLU09296.1 naringenin-chalcone synthase [Kocuria sp. SM24M-10]
MTPALLSLGTALPPHVLEQTDAQDLYQAQPGTDRLNARLLRTVFGASGVARRHTVLSELVDHDAREDSPYITGDGRFRAPLTGARNRTYMEEAPGLFAAAARDALARCPAVDPTSITDVVTVSCTGFFAPGPDYHLVRDLGLNPATRRSHIGFMGCHGGLIGLRQAAAIATADPDAVVLLVAVELCTLHLRPARDADAIRGAALFADGAAAALIGSRVPDGCAPLLQLDRFRTLVIPDGEQAMAWTIGDSGFEMILGAAVPQVLEDNIHAALESLLEGPGGAVDRASITDWALHPGGRGILDKLEHTLDLAPEALRESRDVLATRGNMSSVTVLHVLRQVIDEAPPGEDRTVCALAFGPGLTVESALFTIPARPAAPAAHAHSATAVPTP